MTVLAKGGAFLKSVHGGYFRNQRFFGPIPFRSADGMKVPLGVGKINRVLIRVDSDNTCVYMKRLDDFNHSVPLNGEVLLNKGYKNGYCRRRVSV